MTTPEPPAAARSTPEALGRELARALAPLESFLSNPEDARMLVNALGWDLPPGVADIGLSVDVGAVIDQLLVIDGSTPDERKDAAVMAVRYAELLAKVAGLVADIRTVAAGLSQALSAGYLSATRIHEQFALRLLDYLIIRYAEQEHSRVYRLLVLIGIFQLEAKPADPAIFQVEHVRRTVAYRRLGQLLSDPGGLATAVYGWDTAGFDSEALLVNVAELLLAFGAALRPGPLPRQVEESLLGRAVPEADTDPMPRVAIDLIRGLGLDPLAVGLSFFGLRPTAAGGADGGLGIAPFVAGAAELVFPLSATGQAQLELEGSVAAEFGLALLARPGGKFEIQSLGPPIPAGAKVAVRLRWLPPSGQNRLILLGAEGAGLDAANAFVELAASPDELQLAVGVSGGAVGVKPSGDGFLAHVVPPDGLTATFDLVIGWSSRGGLRVRGGAGLETTIQLGTELGPLLIESVYVGFRIAESGIRLVVAASPSLALGPFAAAIDRIGLRLDISFPQAGGNLGPMQLGAGFSPPAGVGLAIATPAVSGGGFLELDYDAGRYAGVFELTIVGTVSVKAVAIITTKLADGSPGFALLILITAEGFTPVQLGMGFSLTGIGGLLAINHTVDPDAVRGGLRDGVLDSILFVKDPVKNATRILATLEKVFPPAPDRLLIGPLAEISWGSPPLVKIRLALLLEVPQPIRVVLLAALSLALPTTENPVVELHIDSIGVLDLGRQELALDASLHDSRILKFTLTGDMALRLNWGQEPAFVMSIGGFHPKAAVPKGMRPLNRLALTLSGSDNPRVRFEAYLALTSNSIQLGARVDVHAEVAGFGLDGGGSFDALIQWSPFALDVSFAAWAKITAGGMTLIAVSLSLDVTGPQPWHITGQASVQVLMFTASVGVDLTLGAAPAAPAAVETFDVGAEIWAQLSNPARWEATLPATVTPGVTLAGMPVASQTAPLVAHPLARITVRQQIAPLGTPIERVGGRLPAAGTRSYTASLSAADGMASGAVADLFAPGQYANLPEDARLAGPAFVPMPGGLSLTAQAAASAGPGLSWDMAVQTLDVTSLDTAATPGAWVAATGGTSRAPRPAPALRAGRVTT
ncbi:MAG TPA: DUF6603 domain-containing protein [Streptosporangiaceae bacterium]